ncbi:hypothetical protein PflCFBP13510_02690 [Pseudomonas fluorescens]|nr:hypothetical protein PflCFBP13510_02690 [Pseudomonas fluorescens]
MGIPLGTLRVRSRGHDAERRVRHSHAERGNDQRRCPLYLRPSRLAMRPRLARSRPSSRAALAQLC